MVMVNRRTLEHLPRGPGNCCLNTLGYTKFNTGMVRSPAIDRSNRSGQYHQKISVANGWITPESFKPCILQVQATDGNVPSVPLNFNLGFEQVTCKADTKKGDQKTEYYRQALRVPHGQIMCEDRRYKTMVLPGCPDN